jgi:hypothetical protein
MDINTGSGLDLTYQLPRDTYWQLIHTLSTSLPAPVTDTPEARVHRDNAAIAHVASMLPANADEANLAALHVAALAHAHNRLRLAELPGMDPALAMKYQAQAISMMREARAMRSLLIRVQAARQKREADGVALNKANWIEHCAIGLMADALGRIPPAPMEQPPPAPVEEAEPPFEQLSEADQYAIIHPRRAALIRAHGGLPAKCDFGRPEPELAHEIATGTSPILRALDTPERHAAD